MAKNFENEWILDELSNHPSFRTKGMFGGLAVYIYDKQVMVIVEPTKSGRWDWHGVLICTDKEHQASLIKEMPALAPHEVLKKWLFLDSAHDDFEETVSKVSDIIEQNDPRIGIFPKVKTVKKNKK